MLERARACLELGARESLRTAAATAAAHATTRNGASAKPAPSRSRRALHAGFWKHGAGGVDVMPVWALGVTGGGSGRDGMYNHGKGRRGKRMGGRRGMEEMAVAGQQEAVAGQCLTDGVFLDFLYPPRALAWMQSGAPRALETRGARRPPAGPVKGARRYASGPMAGDGKGTVASPERAQQVDEASKASAAAPTGNADNVQSDPLSDEAPAERLDQFDRETMQAGDGDAEPSQTATYPFGSASPSDLYLEASDHWTATSDSVHMSGSGEQEESVVLNPIDAEGQPQDLDADRTSEGEEPEIIDPEMAFVEIQQLIASRPRGSMAQSDSIERVIERANLLYNTLAERRRGDVRLKIQYLQWLISIHHDLADSHAIALYPTIPTESRTAEIYHSTLRVFLRRRNYPPAFKLFRQALREIENPLDVAMTFFMSAIEDGRWSVAMNVERVYLNIAQRRQWAEPRKKFWLQVSRTPGLIVKAFDLARYLGTLQRAQTVTIDKTLFCATFFKEALLQEFQIGENEPTFGPNGVKKQSVRRLFKVIRSSGDPDFDALSRDILRSLVQRRARHRYEDVHELVSWLYLQLRKKDISTIGQDGFMLLLGRLTQYHDARQREYKPRNNLEISVLATDWKELGLMPKGAIVRLLNYYARRGAVEPFQEWFAYLKTTLPTYDEQKSALWTLVYLHARRADLPAAQAAFDEIFALAEAHGQSPELRCWNALTHAYQRAGDLDGGLATIERMLSLDLRPDHLTFHSVTEMLSKRGDVDGVTDLIEQYQALGDEDGLMEANLVGSLVGACVNAGKLTEAETALRNAIQDWNDRKLRGSLTGSFNILLAAFGRRRNFDGVSRVYSWMQKAGIGIDTDTYAALISSLTLHRRTEQAYKVLKTMSTKANLQPTAFHYALVMAGYLKQNMIDSALDVYDRMVARNVRQSVSSNAVYIKAKALKEHTQTWMGARNAEDMEPLDGVVNEMLALLDDDLAAGVAAKQPQQSLDNPSQASENYFDFLIQLHGQRRCMKAVQFLYEKSLELRSDGSSSIRVLTSLSTAFLRSGNYEQVEQCWELAKKEADRLSAVVNVPRLRRNQVQGEDEDDMSAADELAAASPQTASDEVKTRQVVPVGEPAIDVSRKASDITPARTHILTGALRPYMTALSAQARTKDLLKTFSTMFAQGYNVDNRTWNAFIRMLVEGHPPLVLLAFTLTERFLMPNFPGWQPVSKRRPFANRSAAAEGMQFVRRRYLAPGHLVPQYKTMVMLASALLRLRGIDAEGRRGTINADDLKDLAKYIGTSSQVRDEAPKTVFAVQCLPHIPDRMQEMFIRNRRE